MLDLSGHPFDVVTSRDEHWSFVTLDSSVAVLSDRAFVPRLVGEVWLPGHPLGEAVTRDGRYLLVADDSGAVVISVAAAERRGGNALLGVLRAPTRGQGGGVEVVISTDDRYAFVTREAAHDLAVFNLQKALLDGFESHDFVGSVPLGVAPTGLALAPDGRWAYATSESQEVSVNNGAGGSRGLQPAPGAGILTVINVARAESHPASAVASTVPAASIPARVAVSPDGRTVWVTARGSNSLLQFSAAEPVNDPGHALLDQIGVGASPVGLTTFRGGTRIIVVDSNRFATPGSCGSLTLVDAGRAGRGRPASLGPIHAGGFPRKVALEPGGRVLLVSNYSSARLEAIDLSGAP
jgi:DNA-binding beta-propeller fold protein YncE